MAIISVERILEGKANIDVVKETADQLIKDFQLFDENIQFSGNTNSAYQELMSQVLPIIDRLLNLDSSRFFSLLYAIDINEVQIKKILFEGQKEDQVSQQITDLILERELIKVLTRRHFSN